MTTILNFFPPVILAIREEIKNHPKLLEILSAPGAVSSLEEWTAIVAAYCGMVLDGYYTESQLEIIYNDMYMELRKRSTIHLH